MWRAHTAAEIEAMIRANYAGDVAMALLQQLRDMEALGPQCFFNHAADEDDPEAWHSIAVLPYEHWDSIAICPTLWERYRERASQGATETLLIALVNRRGDVSHAPVDYDGRILYFHLLWDAASGSCEVVEEGRIMTYWGRGDLADVFSQLYDISERGDA